MHTDLTIMHSMHFVQRKQKKAVMIAGTLGTEYLVQIQVMSEITTIFLLLVENIHHC
jgi:hypothetical protein